LDQFSTLLLHLGHFLAEAVVGRTLEALPDELEFVNLELVLKNNTDAAIRYGGGVTKRSPLTDERSRF
jgi:hypothetical protein